MSERDNHTPRFCMMCRRMENEDLKMIDIPGGMCVCTDCLQNSFNMMNDPNLQNMLGLGNIFQGMPGMPWTGAAPDAQQSKEETKAEDERFSDAQPAVQEDEENAQVVDAVNTAVTALDEQEPEGESDVKESEDEEGENSQGSLFGIPGLGNIPGVSVINLGNLMNLGQGHQKPKSKKPKKEPKIKDLKSIPAPHKINEALSEYVIGQEYPKKVISVAVYNHYKRIFTNTMDEIEIDKSNILLLGPTGCGKTYLVKTLARILDVPLAIADATSLTEAGYIGDDIESVISKLLAAADNDVERCEQGIVFIDEIDKIAKKKNQSQRDVSGESVQQGLLSLLEGSKVEVPVGASSKNAMVPMTTVNTRNILFICGGAFPGLDEIVKTRLSKHAAIGYGADLRDQWDDDPDILTKVTPEDLRNFGMIPEFTGRLPVICALKSMTKEMLIQIMKEPKNAILRQYQKLLELDEVKLTFDESAYEAIAEKALERKTGARALRAVVEEFMLDLMYEIPKDDNIGEVIITGDYVRNGGMPGIVFRGQA